MVNLQKIFAIVALVGLSLPAYADRGGSAFSRGAKAERLGNYDDAYAAYKEAYTAAPGNAKYLAAYTRLRFSAAAQHVHTGETLLRTGSLAQALAEFQHAAQIDATNGMAQGEAQRTTELIRQQQKRAEQKLEPPPPPVEEDFGKSIELKPLSTAPITLHLTATSDAAYRTICKLAGINVIMDPEFHGQKITIDLTDVTLYDALNLVGMQSKSFWKPVLPNTIVVAADSSAKRKELEQNVMKTFYLKNVTTPTELQDAANVVKTILDVSHIQLLQGQDAMILRGTPDQMVLAEKLLTDIDKPKSEVVIDISVMQVNRDRLRTIGTNVPTSASFGILPSGGSAGTGSSANGGFKIGSFVVSVPGGSVTALASDSNTKVLQNPQIRALNNEKATLRIGDRVPIATGSFSPGIGGGGGVNSLISTQFTYLDVGVNIDITPHIHNDNEVTLKMSLEISSLSGSETIGGITQPIIGQRRIELDTRLQDGEVNLLGGILEDSETKSLSGYPWLSKVPLLKYLFGQENKDHTENEIVFAITPHIVRSLNVTDANVRTVRVGTGSTIELHHTQVTPPGGDPKSPGDPAKLKQPGAQPRPANASTPGARSPNSQVTPIVPSNPPAAKLPSSSTPVPPAGSPGTAKPTQTTSEIRSSVVSAWPVAGASQ